MQALALKVRLRDAGGEMLEDEGEGTNENGGGRIEFTSANVRCGHMH